MMLDPPVLHSFKTDDRLSVVYVFFCSSPIGVTNNDVDRPRPRLHLLCCEPLKAIRNILLMNLSKPVK
jgi:hypothetical protein